MSNQLKTEIMSKEKNPCKNWLVLLKSHSEEMGMTKPKIYFGKWKSQHVEKNLPEWRKDLKQRIVNRSFKWVN